MEYHQKSNLDPLAAEMAMWNTSSSSLPIIRPVSHDASLSDNERENHDSFGWADFPILTNMFSLSSNNSAPHHPQEPPQQQHTSSMTDGLFGATMGSITIHPPHVSGPPKHGDEEDFAGNHVSFGWGDFPVLAHSTMTNHAPVPNTLMMQKKRAMTRKFTEKGESGP